MIEWLEQDGFYRGIVGWGSDWTPAEIYEAPSSEPCVLGFMEETDGDRKTPQARHYDLNAFMRETAREEREKKLLKKTIQEHKDLIPKAIEEINRRLLKAGLGARELDKLTTGQATDAFQKLQKLSELTGPPPPPQRLHFQIMSDLWPREWQKTDIYLPRNCLLVDFEESMYNHRLVRAILPKASDSSAPSVNGPKAPDPSPTADPVLMKRKGVTQKVWAYKIVCEQDSDTELNRESGWTAICDQYDFLDLMRLLVKDKTKFAAICHVGRLVQRIKCKI
jgi:import inner membrane translocase subunit TIM23